MLPPTGNCPGGQAEIEINIETNGYGNETTWFLQNVCAKKYVLESPLEPYEGNSTYNHKECVADNMKYIFAIDGSGGYSVKYKGQLIKEGDVFDSEEVTAFGACKGPCSRVRKRMACVSKSCCAWKKGICMNNSATTCDSPTPPPVKCGKIRNIRKCNRDKSKCCKWNRNQGKCNKKKNCKAVLGNKELKL